MALFFAAVLIIVGIVGAIALPFAVAGLLALMVWDVYASRRNRPVVAEEAAEEPITAAGEERAKRRISVERGVARGFVILGGLFWGVTVFAGLYSFRETGMAYALLGAFIPFLATLVTLVIGWYYERAVAILLLLATVAVIAYGVMTQFEAGVWTIVTFALIGPMLTASVLFWLARRDQEALELRLSKLAAMSAPAGQLATEEQVS